MSTEIKTLSERIKPNAWLTSGETGNILAASMQEAAELRAALAVQYHEISDLVEMQPGGALYQPPAPVGYVFGNSYYEVGNPRLTEEIKRLGKARYGDPQAHNVATIKDSLTVQAPSAPVARNMSAEFEAWAKREGLIQESHGIRSTSSACAVAQRAFDAGAALSVKAGPAETVASVCGVDYVMVRRDAIDWLKAKNPAICEKSGLCEKIGGRLYTRTCGGWNEVAAPTPPTTGEA